MDGALRLALSSGTHFTAGASLDLNFQSDKYLLNNSQTTKAAIDALHSRPSIANDFLPNELLPSGHLSSGDYAQYPLASARITSHGFLCEEAAIGLVDPFDLSPYQTNNCIVTDHAGTHLGLFNNAKTIASTGAAYGRHRPVVSNVANGDVLSACFWYQGGTSGRQRFHINGTTGAGNPQMEIGGLLGTLPSAASVTSFGDLTDVEVFNLGDNYYLARAKFTATADITNFGWGLSHDSAVVGENIHLLGQDIKASNVYTTPSYGARAEDNLIIPTSAAILDLAEGFAFIKWTEQDNDFDQGNAPHLLQIGGASSGEGIGVLRENLTGRILLQITENAVLQGEATASKVDIGSTNTIGLTWGSGSARFVINGIYQDDHSVMSPSGYAGVSIGCDLAGGAVCNTLLHRAVIGQTKLSDDDFSAIYNKISA